MALLRRAKIINIGITSDFGTWKTLPENVGKLLKIKILRYLFWELCIGIDKLLNKFYKNNKNYYCSIIFLCEK